MLLQHITVSLSGFSVEALSLFKITILTPGIILEYIVGRLDCVAIEFASFYLKLFDGCCCCKSSLRSFLTIVLIFRQGLTSHFILRLSKPIAILTWNTECFEFNFWSWWWHQAVGTGHMEILSTHGQLVQGIYPALQIVWSLWSEWLQLLCVLFSPVQQPLCILLRRSLLLIKLELFIQ